MRNSRVLAASAAISLALAGCGAGHTSHQSVVHHQPAVTQSAMGSVHPASWGATPKGLVSLPPAVTSAPTKEMFDSITTATIPVNAQYLAGYNSGHWQTYFPFVRLPWHPKVKSIAVTAGFFADCLDVEPGDAVPSQAGPWVVQDMAHGYKTPCVYSDLSEMPAVQASIRSSLGLNWRSRVFLWLAWYRFLAGLVAGYDAVQWTDHAFGLNLDESTATNTFLGIHPVTKTVCFGKNAQNTAKCKAVRKQVADWQSAAKNSQVAVNGTQDAIVRLENRKKMFQQRVNYFNHKASSTIKAFS